jgi:hypothetical protein
MTLSDSELIQRLLLAALLACRAGGDRLGQCSRRRRSRRGQYHLAFIATAVTLVVLFVVAPIETAIERRVAPGAKDGPPTGA